MEESAVRKIPPGVGTRFLPDDGCIAQEVASTGQILQEQFTPGCHQAAKRRPCAHIESPGKICIRTRV